MNNISYIDDIPVSLNSNSELFALISGWLTTRQCSRHIVTLNALMLIAAVRDHPLKVIIQGADLVTIDGYGIFKVLQKKDYLNLQDVNKFHPVNNLHNGNGQNIQRLSGMGLTKELLRQSCLKGYSVYFVGGTPQTAALMKKVLPARWPGLNISGIHDGYGINLPFDNIEREIIERQPHILLVGLGVPKQELFLAGILPHLNSTVGVGIGGIFEILCGLKREAPTFIRNHGWEWCFRMAQDPRKFKHLPDLVRFWFRYLR